MPGLRYRSGETVGEVILQRALDRGFPFGLFLWAGGWYWFSLSPPVQRSHRGIVLHA